MIGRQWPGGLEYVRKKAKVRILVVFFFVFVVCFRIRPRREKRSVKSPLFYRQEEFRKNAHLTEEVDIKRAVARGRWYVRNEMAGMIMLAKYRAMKRRYYD